MRSAEKWAHNGENVRFRNTKKSISRYLPGVPVLFYVPRDKWPQDIDLNHPTYSWGEIRYGKWNWTIQTYTNLRKSGFECRITNSLEEDGIVFAHRGVIHSDYIPHSKQLLVCILAERTPHDFCQNHILQNPLQAKKFRNATRSMIDKHMLGVSHKYFKYWPQPELIPRCELRGDSFFRIVFFGVENQVDPSLMDPNFKHWMKVNGFVWDLVFDKSKWKDYSEVDAVVAVRRFGVYKHDNKPASKLVNSWLAGVPALLGVESAFQYEGSNGVDYIEVDTLEDLKNKLLILRENVSIRHSIVENGRKKVCLFDVDAVVKQWVEYIEGPLTDAYFGWISMSNNKRSFYWFLKKVISKKRMIVRKICNRIGFDFNAFV